MRKYLFIGLGGALAAICKFLLEGIHIYQYEGNIPINTMSVNIAGSFLLALILTVAFEVWEFNIDLRMGIAAGFLGSCTTFQTLCSEVASLLARGDYFSAISYLTFSTMVGLAATYCGLTAAKIIISKIDKEEDTKALEETDSIGIDIDS